MSCDSCRAALASDWLLFFQYGKNKDHAKEGEKGKPKKVNTRVEVHVQPEEPSVPVEPPVFEVEAPPTPSEMERRRAEVEKLEEVRRYPESSLTQHFAQIAAEARSSMSGREDLARRKL